MTDISINFSYKQLILVQQVAEVATQVASTVTPDSSTFDYFIAMARRLRLDGFRVMESDSYKQRNYGALLVNSQLVVMIFHDETMVRPHYYITQDFLHASCSSEPGLILNFAHNGSLQAERCIYDREQRLFQVEQRFD